MNFRIGDKVKFLNDKGGGIVSKILDSRTVTVMVEGGFELPTLVSELVKIEPENAGGRFFDESFGPGTLTGKELPGEPEDERTRSLPESSAGLRKAEEVSLAFVPHDQKWLITGLVDVLLVNHTACDVLYSIYLKNEKGNYFGKDYGSVFPDNSVLLDTIDRETLSSWSEGVIQLLFHTDLPGEILPPFNAGYRIAGKKFFSESSYRESLYFEGRGIVIRLLSLAQHRSSGKKPEPDPGTPSLGINEEAPLILRHRTDHREAEVDLHIQEIVPPDTTIDPQGILGIQKQYFERCMESALAEQYRKVIFIHGVGNGTLRQLLLDQLKKYEGIEVSDAPMSKYGVGALEVRIHQNR